LESLLAGFACSATMLNILISWDDAQLIAIAKKERRVLLTRDLELFQQATAKGVQAFYVDGKNEAENLAKISQKFGINLEVDMKRSRCPKCNAQVKPISKEKVSGKVKETTYTHYNEFWECPKCRPNLLAGSPLDKDKENP